VAKEQFNFKNNKKKAILFLILIILSGGYFFAYRPYLKIRAKIQAVVAEGKELKTVFSQNDIDLLNDKFVQLELKYQDLKKESASIYWLSFIPYIADYKNGIEAGDYLISAGKETIAAIAPYADMIGFRKGKGSFVEKSAEDRLQTAILTLDKVLSKIDNISEDIRQAELRLDRIDSNRYPEKIGKTLVKKQITDIKEQFKGLASLFVDAKPLVKNLPVIFGKDKEKTYLVLFQNDKERRATGGFLTAYAIFKIKDGKITVERSKDIYTLDDSISNHPSAPAEIRTYFPSISTFYIRDSNLSPDFPTSVKLFNSLYKNSGERVNYDGIIALDTKVLVDMLEVFGDTEVRGINFSSRIDPRCNCPSVIYKLLDEIDRPVNYIKTDRKGILGDLMYELFYKAIRYSPSKYWGKLVQQMFTNLQEKHILLYFTDADLEAAVDRLNFAGSIKHYDGDYLHVNNVNFSGAKTNLFIMESIASETKTNDGGKITRVVTVEFKNPYPHSDCNLERGGLCLNALHKNWIRVYVPLGAELVSFSGSTKKVQSYQDLGKTVFEGFVEVPTQGMAKAVIKYTLPQEKLANHYKLLIQKQPGVLNQKLKVIVNGKNLYDQAFVVDQELKLK
jgi:hypothetical protein